MRTKLLTFFVACLSISSCNNYPVQPEITPTPVITPLPKSNIVVTINPTPTPTISPTIAPTPQVIASNTVIIKNTSPTPSNALPTPIPNPTFAPPIKTNNILFDTSIRPFKENNANSISNLTKLTNLLTKEKYNVLFDSINNKDLNLIDTIVIISPYIEYSDADIEKLKSFVLDGKKVFILGEWGGYGGFNASGVNKLLELANLKINQDVVKESDSNNYDFSDEQLLVKDFLKHPINTNVSTLCLYSSATIDVIDISKSNALITSQTSNTSFRISSYSKSGVIGISQYGNGKIIVSGDSSILLDTDTNLNSISNIDELDNSKFILNVFKW
ncbi:MAG: DUF4350 domain-containing protein [Candidatus Sericytochromatia bacterium]